MVRRGEAKVNLCGFEGAGKGRKIPNHDNPIFPVTIA